MNIGDEWICLDFNENCVTPIHETWQSRHDYGKGARHHLKSWILEGCETSEGQSWLELGLRKDTTELDNKSARATFPIREPKECRYIRVRAIEPNHNSTHHFALACLELFGTLWLTEPLGGSPTACDSVTTAQRTFGQSHIHSAKSKQTRSESYSPDSFRNSSTEVDPWAVSFPPVTDK
jgi:hypothetical protein